MNKNYLYLAILIVILIVVFYLSKRRENLSLSQWMPNKEDCSSLIQPPAPVMDPYPKNVRINCNLPGDKRLRLKNCSFYRTFSDETLCAGCGGCSSCLSKPMLYSKDTCFKTTPTKDNNTTVRLPPIADENPVLETTTIKNMNINKVMKHVEAGDLVISAKNMKVIEYLLFKLKYPGGNGFPDFYNVDGPVTVLTKDGGIYYYIIDYPIKYRPNNINKYVNSTVYSDYIKDAWIAGIRLQENCNPVVIFKNNKDVNFINPLEPKKIKTECCKSVWGPPYGCGNWTLRV